MELLRLIWNWVKRFWDKIKKIVVQIINFFKNIVDWFKNPFRLNKLKENENMIAASIKQKLENGDFAIVNALYDKYSDQVVDAQIVQSKDLDHKTKEAFRNKDMIILT